MDECACASTHSSRLAQRERDPFGHLTWLREADKDLLYVFGRLKAGVSACERVTTRVSSARTRSRSAPRQNSLSLGDNIQVAWDRGHADDRVERVGAEFGEGDEEDILQAEDLRGKGTPSALSTLLVA